MSLFFANQIDLDLPKNHNFGFGIIKVQIESAVLTGWKEIFKTWAEGS